MRTLTSTRRSARKQFMMSITTTAPDRSIWTPEDEARLVQFLREHHAEGGDGAGFKQSVWNGAAEELSKHITRGGPKTSAACKSKWDRACYHIYCLLILTNDT